jgi:hypothetical protein
VLGEKVIHRAQLYQRDKQTSEGWPRMSVCVLAFFLPSEIYFFTSIVSR